MSIQSLTSTTISHFFLFFCNKNKPDLQVFLHHYFLISLIQSESLEKDMEYWTLFNNSNGSSNNNNIVRGQNGNFSHPPAWNHPTSTSTSPYPPQSAAATMLHSCSPPTTYCNPDQHLTCLKLGKRQYFEDMIPPPPPFSVTKQSKPHVNAPTGGDAATPKCQVEGCGSLLVNAKDYHRRHKVCEMHAKAPKVVLLGIDQRFCQQCSRFHAVAEFDEAKRSCRRRLAGHNERRRKSSQGQNSIARKHYHDIKLMVAGGHPPPHLLSNAACALSPLSPTNYSPYHAATTSYDLSMSCSAALRELIAENRASAGNFNTYRLRPSWPVENRAHVTLDLMQGQESVFGPDQDRRLSEEDGDGDCAEFWNLPGGY